MAYCGIYATLKDPHHKHFTDPNHPAIAACQSTWNGMITQQAHLHVVTPALSKHKHLYKYTDTSLLDLTHCSQCLCKVWLLLIPDLNIGALATNLTIRVLLDNQHYQCNFTKNTSLQCVHTHPTYKIDFFISLSHSPSNSAGQ